MNKGFITILPFMVSELELSGNDLIIYAIIYGFCQDSESKFYGSLSYLSNRSGVTRRGVMKILKRLIDGGYIIRTDETNNGIKYVKYHIGTTFIGGEQRSYGGEQRSSSGEQRSPNIKEYKRDNKDNTDELEQMFNSFWEAYPKKVGKAPAKKAFDKINPDKALFDIMLSAIMAQSSSEQWQKDNRKFIPYPATWLNQERWNDEVELNEQVDDGNGFDFEGFDEWRNNV